MVAVCRGYFWVEQPQKGITVMRLVRMAAFVGSLVLLYAMSVVSPMAGSPNVCGGATVAASNDLLARLGSPQAAQTCGGTQLASKQCCAQSICNCNITTV